MNFLAFLLVLAPKAFALRVHPRTATSMGLAGAGDQGPPPTPRVHVGGRRSFFAGTVAAISSAALAGVSTPASAKELALAPADLLFDELKDLKVRKIEASSQYFHFAYLNLDLRLGSP